MNARFHRIIVKLIATFILVFRLWSFFVLQQILCYDSPLRAIDFRCEKVHIFGQKMVSLGVARIIIGWKM